MTDHDRAVAAWLRRTETFARRLADDYERLGEHLAPVVRGRDGSGIRPRSARPSVPIRVEVVDLAAEVDKFAEDTIALVRGTLRTGPVSATSTPERLRFIAGSLFHVEAVDPGLVDSITDEIWRLAGRAHAIVAGRTGRSPRPFRAEEVCPECAEPHLWVYPKEWVIVCAIPSCRYTSAIDAPVGTERVRHATGTAVVGGAASEVG